VPDRNSPIGDVAEEADRLAQERDDDQDRREDETDAAASRPYLTARSAERRAVASSRGSAMG
jgi:hypothetical protein